MRRWPSLFCSVAHKGPISARTMAWGSVWSRPDLDRRTRSLITVAILAALGREHELALHLRASRNTGVSETELAEALLHVALYAGIPAANTAFAIAKAELGSEP